MAQARGQRKAPPQGQGQGRQGVAVIWTIGELVEAATNPESVPLRHARFTVIDGGRI